MYGVFTAFYLESIWQPRLPISSKLSNTNPKDKGFFNFNLMFSALVTIFYRSSVTPASAVRVPQNVENGPEYYALKLCCNPTCAEWYMWGTRRIYNLSTLERLTSELFF